MAGNHNDAATLSAAAASAVSARRVVKLSSSGLAHSAAATDVVVGVAPEAIGSGEVGDYHVRGTVPVTVSGAISRGGRVACDASGKAKAWATGNTVIGVALTAAAADGEEITLLLTL